MIDTENRMKESLDDYLNECYDSGCLAATFDAFINTTTYNPYNEDSQFLQYWSWNSGYASVVINN
jgi:hypothetical protein